jgi:hypothetical protein
MVISFLFFFFSPLSLGGHNGFDKKLWEVAEYKKGENPSITFKYHSCDGEEGISLSLSLSLSSLTQTAKIQNPHCEL